MLKEYTRPCHNNKCKEDALQLQLDNTAHTSTGVKICKRCKTRHIFEATGGKLMLFVREKDMHLFIRPGSDSKKKKGK